MHPPEMRHSLCNFVWTKVVLIYIEGTTRFVDLTYCVEKDDHISVISFCSVSQDDPDPNFISTICKKYSIQVILLWGWRSRRMQFVLSVDKGNISVYMFYSFDFASNDFHVALEDRQCGSHKPIKSTMKLCFN
ncbi:hypothetical protein Leryth_010045 [Lithospermum erythrorhizon]|nr:hypothetical protein Leryth_010045 [Lithospermum erythrorhizon]